jgi:hypothetical protein
VSRFYLLPPKPFLGRCFARYLEGLFPGLTWDSAAWPNLADGLAAAATCQDDVYVVYREELPDDDDPVRALADDFGAEPGDEVIEVRIPGAGGQPSVRRWRIDRAA